MATAEQQSETEARHARNRAIIDEFRANSGKMSGRFENEPIVLLHTTGARSGNPRVNPLMSMPKDGVLYVFASKAGGPTNPDWYYNLLANPDVTVEFGTETFVARAQVLTGAERDKIYAEQTAIHPNFADYEEKTERTIPVIALIRK